MFNLTFALDFLVHRFRSKNRHGLHSPFIYQLVDEVIYNRKPNPIYDRIEESRNHLLADDRMIAVTDFGAGSHVNNNKLKKISDITLNALKPPRLAQLLYRLAAFMQPQNIIELGTCLGITTLYLKAAAPAATIYSLEGCPQTADVAQDVFDNAGVEDIHLVTGNFDETLPGILNKFDRLDCVYIDGNHKKDATLKYFEWCLPKTHEKTLLIFDDIYWSSGMKAAWQQIKTHPEVTITVDLFWIGLVFFRTGKVKENFKIRY